MRLRVLLCVLSVLALASGSMRVQAAQPLWNEAAGDNNNLMSMFMPQQQAPPQQQQQPNPQAAQLIAQVASLLQAAAQTQQQQQQQQPQQQQQAVANPYQNLYGARAPAPVAAAQDSSFLAARTGRVARDTILPLARRGTSGYLFSASHPPADVVAARRRAAPRHVSSLEMFGRIPRPRVAHSRRSPLSGLNHLINLERDTRRAPVRALPRPSAQRRFRLRAPRRVSRAVDPRHMARVLSSNPFLAKLQPDGDETTEFLELDTEAAISAPADASDVRVLQELDAQASALVDAEADSEFEADAESEAEAESEQPHLSAEETDAIADATLDAEVADEMAQF